MTKGESRYAHPRCAGLMQISRAARPRRDSVRIAVSMERFEA